MVAKVILQRFRTYLFKWGWSFLNICIRYNNTITKKVCSSATFDVLTGQHSSVSFIVFSLLKVKRRTAPFLWVTTIFRLWWRERWTHKRCVVMHSTASFTLKQKKKINVLFFVFLSSFPCFSPSQRVAPWECAECMDYESASLWQSEWQFFSMNWCHHSTLI